MLTMNKIQKLESGEAGVEHYEGVSGMASIAQHPPMTAPSSSSHHHANSIGNAPSGGQPAPMPHHGAHPSRSLFFPLYLYASNMLPQICLPLYLLSGNADILLAHL